MHALLLDYNGVVVDDEPLHYASFREVLAEDGIRIDEQSYAADYLGMDDRAAFRKAYQQHGKPLDDATHEAKIRDKSRRYLARAERELTVVPGVGDFVRAVAALHARIAVVSGALGEEIPLGLRRAGIADLVDVIVCSGDVATTKPDPGGFRLALQRLAARHGTHDWSVAVVEDSLPGIGAAKALGAGCVAITTSHGVDELQGADVIWSSFEKHEPLELDNLWRRVSP